MDFGHYCTAAMSVCTGIAASPSHAVCGRPPALINH